MVAKTLFILFLLYMLNCLLKLCHVLAEVWHGCSGWFLLSVFGNLLLGKGDIQTWSINIQHPSGILRFTDAKTNDPYLIAVQCLSVIYILQFYLFLVLHNLW